MLSKVAVTLPFVWLKAVKVLPAAGVPVIVASNALIAAARLVSSLIIRFCNF